MTGLGEDTLNNLSFVDVVCLYINRLFGYFGLTSNFNFVPWTDEFSVKFLTDNYDALITWFAFDDFQIKLLKVFCFTLLADAVIIYFIWRHYGKQIYRRFMKPEATKAIDELRKSVAQLKLPTEHTPRI